METDCILSKRAICAGSKCHTPLSSSTGRQRVFHHIQHSVRHRYTNTASLRGSLLSPAGPVSPSFGSTMPVQTSQQPPVLDSFPSFMSVFDGTGTPQEISYKEEQSTAVKPLRVPTNVTVNTSRRPLPFQHHRESVSSMTSSADSSPTTTISTFDSPSAPDTSPSSSPESPTSMPYPKFMPPARNIESQSLSAAHKNFANQTSDQPSDSATTPNPLRPDSPGRRARNLKNLSLRMPPPSQSARPPIATASVMETSSQNHISAPPSPAALPQRTKSSRRKPANLTIRTPGFDRSFSNIEMVPPTPHTLRHTESSPSLHSVFSPSFGPKGGMQLPRPVTHHGSRRPSAPGDGNSPMKTRPDDGSVGVLHDLAEEDDHLDSRESTRRKDRGYPNGPIRIYDSGVYLYLEPTAEEASNFDVVVNVAKEVANPFTKSSSDNGTVMSAWRNASPDSARPSMDVPRTGVSDASFKSAFEWQPSENNSPATTRSESSGPEYVHVRWDHNSEILDDLYPLCELIDDRVSQGKKVLIHCQLGASRSASLVIAYGLYKNRHLDFNSMYEIVKDRSQWVGPNMSLIYQLTDFRSRLMRGCSSKPAPQEWFVGGPRRCSEPHPSRAGSDRPELRTPSDAGNTSTGYSQASMSSLSVPSTNQTTPTSAESLNSARSLSHKRSFSPRPLPLRQSSFHTLHSAYRSGQSDQWRFNGGPGSFSKTDLFLRDAGEDPSALFSPRTTGFMAAPLAPSVLEAPEDGPSSFSIHSRFADPRSPPPGNERLIMRNIDEFL